MKDYIYATVNFAIVDENKVRLDMHEKLALKCRNDYPYKNVVDDYTIFDVVKHAHPGKDIRFCYGTMSPEWSIICPGIHVIDNVDY